MAISLEVSFFNSYWLKKTLNGDGDLVAPKYAGGTGDAVDDDNKNWYIEESRIRGGFNNTITDLGKKAHLVEDSSEGQERGNALIYSGIFNSRTNVNDTNVFSTGESITTAVDPFNGSIQKLYADDSNLLILQESKVSKALIDKDAIYTAEGNAAITTSNKVIGQIIPYAGEYGISTDPNSFAVYGYQKYFTDVRRNAVLRLSQNGITEISQYGMKDWFRDNLVDKHIVGCYDTHTKQYVLSLAPKVAVLGNIDGSSTGEYTLSFDETVQGWVSFYSYIPTQMVSVDSKFFTFKNDKGFYEQHANATYGKFYDEDVVNSTVSLISNNNVSSIKNFRSVSYEGTNNWEVTLFHTVDDIALPIKSYLNSEFLDNSGDISYNGFKELEGKYHANLVAKNTYNSTFNSNAQPNLKGRVILFDTDVNGQMVSAKSGIKGHFAELTFSTDTSGDYAELFAVNTNTNISSN